MNEVRKRFVVPAALLAAFVLWTAAVCWVDVRAIGPKGSSVGLAGINQLVHRLTGVHFLLYRITDWLGLIPIGICMGFGLLGAVQWVKRKNVLKVDRSLLNLGGFYLSVIAAYALFERFVINYRPVLIDGALEASYPSSTTMLTICVMMTAAVQFNARIKHCGLRTCVCFVIYTFTAFMVAGRMLSGVHWFSDIVGGVLLSAALVTLYCPCCSGKNHGAESEK